MYIFGPGSQHPHPQVLIGGPLSWVGPQITVGALSPGPWQARGWTFCLPQCAVLPQGSWSCLLPALHQRPILELLCDPSHRDSLCGMIASEGTPVGGPWQ